MRSVIACGAVVVVGALLAGPALGGRSNGPPTWRTVTGAINHLGRSRVGVGRLTCFAPSARLLLAGDFALGEKVTIRCSGDVLRQIKHWSAGTSGGNGANGSSVIVSSGANGSSSNTSVGTAANGQSSATSTASASASGSSGSATSVSAEGPVSSITSTSISIGEATCPFDQASYPAGSFAADLAPGDVAKISCSSYANGTTSESISAP